MSHLHHDPYHRSKITGSLLILGLMLTTLILASCTADGKQKKNTNPKESSQVVELDKVIKAIEDSLEESQGHPVAGFPPLQAVTVAVQTTVSKSIGGQVKVFVFNVGARGEIQNASSLTFELKPPPEAPEKTTPSSVNVEDLKNALARQIQAAKLGFLSTQNVKNLKTDKVEIELGFSVSKEVSGGVDTASLLPVGLSADGRFSRNTGNTITLVFALP
jgi:hypothetical protein